MQAHCPSASGPVAGAARYARREPAKSALHQIVHRNLPTLIEQARDPDTGTSTLPAFVIRELEAYLGCGLLSRGFLRAVCEGCGQNVFVAFSCHGRGLCPSCGARRMEDITEHIVKRVVPDVGVRQWVLSLPFALRGKVAFDKDLFASVVRIFMAEIFRAYQRRARDAGLVAPECGGIAFLQRFGAKLNLHGHVHAIVLDGVYAAETPPTPDEHANSADAPRDTSDTSLVFHTLPAPTVKDIEDVTRRVSVRVERILARQRAAEAEENPAEPPEAALHRAAAGIRPVPSSVKNGQAMPVPTFGGKASQGDLRGYSVHAAVAVRAGNEAARRRVIQYCARPPFAEKQVSLLPNGRVAFELRHPGPSGETHVHMTPIGFVTKLAALIPPPRQHQVRYFGVLASASPLRAAVVPQPHVRLRASPQAEPVDATLELPTNTRTAYRARWAALLRRVYDVDALECPRCHGHLRVRAAILEHDTVRKILEHEGLYDEPTLAQPAQDDAAFDFA